MHKKIKNYSSMVESKRFLRLYSAFIFIFVVGVSVSWQCVEAAAFTCRDCDLYSDCKSEELPSGSTGESGCKQHSDICKVTYKNNGLYDSCDAIACEGKTQAGCLVGSGCRWYGGTCVDKSTKKDAKALTKIAEMCNAGASKYWNGQVAPDGACKSNVPVDENGEMVTADTVADWCARWVSDLSDSGKTNCRDAERKESIGDTSACDECVNDCMREAKDYYLNNTIKDSVASEARKGHEEICKSMNFDFNPTEKDNFGFSRALECQKTCADAYGSSDSDLIDEEEVYMGPVFDGPGLHIGSKIARRRLDSTISKESDLTVLVVQWMKFLLPLGAVLAVVALVWAGIMYITAFGDEGQTGKAKKIIMWVAGGIILIFGAYAIVNTIMQARAGAFIENHSFVQNIQKQNNIKNS